MRDELNLKNIIDDISTDMASASTPPRYNKEADDGEYHFSQRERRKIYKSGSSGLLEVSYPNIIGFIAGIMILLIFGGRGLVGCIVMGLSGSVIFGMIDCMIMKKMSLEQALIRNIVMTVILVGVALLLMLAGWIFNR